MDVLEYLDSKNIPLKPGGASNHRTFCFFCHEDDTKPGRLYINTDVTSPNYGRFICFLCETKGGINTLRKHFGDPLLTELKPTETYLRILHEATEYYAAQLLENDEVFDYLTYERGLTLQTIIKHKIGWADGGLLNHLVSLGHSVEEIRETGLVNKLGKDYFRNRITIPYIEFGVTTTIRGRAWKDDNIKYLGVAGAEAKLYGVDNIQDSDAVFLCAGEFDAIMLNQQGYPAVGLPGERIWKPEWTEQVEHAKRIYICLDNDKTGKPAAEKLSVDLGPKCRVVEMPQQHGKKVDVTDYFTSYGKTKEDFDFLISKAKGGLLISVAQAHERWLEVEGNPNLIGLRFNIKALDSQMQHGLLPGQIVTLLARTNTGKSILTFNMLHRMRQVKPDLKVLLLSLEQTRSEWFERQHLINCFYDPTSTTSDTVQLWQNNLFLVDKNRVTQAELETCLDQFNFDVGQYPDVVVVDYLGYFAKSYPGEEYQRISSAMMDIKAVAKEYGSVFFVPHQANRQNDMGSEVKLSEAQGSSLVEQTSDLVLALWNPDQRVGLQKEDHKKELIMKVQKSRGGGVGVQFKMQSAPLTLAIVPFDDPLHHRALVEREYWIAGDDAKQAIYRHKTGDLEVA